MNRTGLPPSRMLLLPMLVALSLGGCATREYVEQEIAGVHKRIAGLEVALGKRLDEQGARIQAAETQIKAVEPRFLAAETRIGRGETETTALGRRLDVTQSDLAAANQNMAGLLAGLNASVQRLDAVAVDMGSTRAQLAALEQQAGAGGQRLDAQAAQIASAQRGMEVLSSTMAQTEARLRALENTVKEVGNTAASAVNTVTAAVAKAEAARTVVTTPAPTPVIEVAALPAVATKAADTPVREAAPMVSPGELDTRLTRVTALIDAVRVRVEESAATFASQRSEDRAAQKATQDALGTLQTTLHTQLAAVDKRMETQAQSTAKVEQGLAGVDAAVQATQRRLGDIENAQAAAVAQRSDEARTAQKATHDALDAMQATLHTQLTSQLAAVDKRMEAQAQSTAKVEQSLAGVNASLNAITQRVDDNAKHLNVLAEVPTRLAGLGERLGKVENGLSALSATTREALDRATTAGKLAEGTFIEETVLTEDVAFEFEKWELSAAAKTALNALVDRLKADNKRVFIEIQGYTDNSGPTAANLAISRLRAETVRDYLNLSAGVPLHRMNVAAYGELNPMADNKTRDGRVKNRRVVLVVLK